MSEPNILEGNFANLSEARFAAIVSRFNQFITEKLLEGCLDCFDRHGFERRQITVVRVPGAWEIPVAAKRLAESGSFAAIIGIGTVIRGSTLHFEHVAGEAAKGLAQVALSTGVPVINSVLATNTLEEAVERAGSKMGNKGWDAAMAAIEMANLFRRMPSD